MRYIYIYIYSTSIAECIVENCMWCDDETMVMFQEYHTMKILKKKIVREEHGVPSSMINVVSQRACEEMGPLFMMSDKTM